MSRLVTSGRDLPDEQESSEVRVDPAKAGAMGFHTPAPNSVWSRARGMGVGGVNSQHFWISAHMDKMAHSPALQRRVTVQAVGGKSTARLEEGRTETVK